jgi:hypothetical protein
MAFEERRVGRYASFDSPLAPAVETPLPVTPVAAVAAADALSTPTSEEQPRARLEDAVVNETLGEKLVQIPSDEILVGGALITPTTDGVHVTFAFEGSDEKRTRLKTWSREFAQGDRRILVMVADSREVPAMAGDGLKAAEEAEKKKAEEEEVVDAADSPA